MALLSISLIYQITIVIVSLVVILLMLLGINYYVMTTARDEQRDLDRLKKEMEQIDRIVTRHSLFQDFIPKSRDTEPF